MPCCACSWAAGVSPRPIRRRDPWSRTRPCQRLALLLLTVALLCSGAPRAGEIHCDAQDEAVNVGLALLRQHLTEPPFSGFDYYIGGAADAVAGPLEDAAALAPEGFSIRPATQGGQPCLALQAPTTAGLTLGLHRLVRNGLAHPRQFGQEPLHLRPAMPIREMYEEHGWDDPAALESYKAKLRLYLSEGFNCLDVPFGWFIPAPEDTKDPAAYLQKWQPHFATVRAVIDYAHALGIQVYLVENPQFSPYFHMKPEELKPERLGPAERPVPAGGLGVDWLLCPSNPRNLAIIRRNRAMLYREFPQADGIVVYFNDPGGCTGPECADWGRTILRTCRDFYEPLLRELAPQYKLRLTLWGTPREASRTVADQLSSATQRIADIQFPPTSPAPPYLVTDPAMLGALGTASRYRPIIMQQFYDGVGYKHGWVNMIEHPMPRLMEQNLRLSLQQGQLVGVYGSAFEFNYQQIDSRLTGEWGWNPQRTADEILTEMGDERLGTGTGKFFTEAVLAMEQYWDLACVQFFSDGTAEDADGAARAAEAAVKAWQQAEPLVTRDREFFTGLQTLASAMQLTSRQTAARAEAATLLAQGQSQQGQALLLQARGDAETITRLLSTGYFAYMPKLGWWANDWVIGRRAATIDTEIALADPARWVTAEQPPAHFTSGKWEAASPGRGKVTLRDDPAGPVAEMNNTAAGVEWTGVVSPPVKLATPTTYRLDCEVRWLKSTENPNAFLAQWVEADGFAEGPRSYPQVPGDGAWHPVTFACVSPPVKAGADCQLRFLLIGEGPQVQVRNLKLSVAKPTTAASSDAH